VVALTRAPPAITHTPEASSLTAKAATQALVVPTPLPTCTATTVWEDSRPPDADPHELDLVQTGGVSETLLGQAVTVEARIDRATLLSAGAKFVLDDGSGPVAVWMPNALYAQLMDPAGWNVGAVGRVTGRVSEYEGELEVVPARVKDVLVVLRAPQVVAADAQISGLSGSDAGRRVTVEATIVAVTPFSAGVNCVLDDGSGQVVLLLWQNVLGGMADQRGLREGARVRATGWVQVYRGELELVPGLAHDLVFLGEPDVP
jgi:DNA/RNA endonuclease YhcR with UshA esterase domain